MMTFKNNLIWVGDSWVKLMLPFITLIFLLGSSAVDASDGIEPLAPEGWHWYEKTPEHSGDDQEEKAQVDPLDQMKTENQAILRALYTARKNPTKENVKQYIMMQKQVVKESKAFSNVWKAVLLDNPDLDYSLLHPTNNSARMVESDQEKKKEDAAIEALSKRSGLFFFYRSTCPYCRAFAPTVKQFAELYGIKVIPITTDGISLPEFPHSRINQGQAERFHVKAEPALFAVNPNTEKAFPITYEMMSLVDLKKRILDIATQFDVDVK